jgi:hypothetical protein
MTEICENRNFEEYFKKAIEFEQAGLGTYFFFKLPVLRHILMPQITFTKLGLNNSYFCI